MNTSRPIALMVTCFAATITISSHAQSYEPDEPRFATAQISMDEWLSYRSEVQGFAHVMCRSDPSHQLICDSLSQRTIWVFTLDGHAAHPAVSRGQMVVAEGAVGIARSGHFVSSREEFERWFGQFQELDERQVVEWRQQAARAKAGSE